jgi:outer membrane receptor protein involved in Fe transport
LEYFNIRVSLIHKKKHKLKERTFWRCLKLTLFCSCISESINAQTGTEVESTTLEVVEVIGISPLSELTLSDKIPYSIQTFGKADIKETIGYSISQILGRRAGSIATNDAQNNPLQPDIRLRGFTASPLLGTSQGVVVYQNGVRINEVFGDTINWDLLPVSTIETVNVIAGSNPVLGLNALGGAISIATKNGFSAPGKTAALAYGSYKSNILSITNGSSKDNWGTFWSIDTMEEEGWRDFSASRALNAYSAISWLNGNSEVDLYLSGGSTNLRGNGSVPEALLEEAREQVFTHPDITKNQMGMASLSFKTQFTSAMQLRLNLFYRNNTTTSFNGDGSEFEECDPPFDSFLCDEDGVQIEDQSANAVSGDFDAINNRSRRKQNSWGGTAQFYLEKELLGSTHHITVGADYLLGETRFESTVELAELTANRSTVGSNLFDSGGFTDLETENQLSAVYITDTVRLTKRLGATFSARYNKARVQTKDQSGERPLLDGSHSFERLNSGLGFTYQLSTVAALYGGIYQASRAPTPVELACSHSEAPCNLPNTFLADPPLDDVVSLSYEVGIRGQTRWLDQLHIGIFHTVNQDDILFQTSGGVLSNQGFFTNAADTRRLGLELNLAGIGDLWSWFANYSYLRATFEDAFLSSSPNHPYAKNGKVPVSAGSQIPGIPEHNFKLGIDYRFSDRLSGSVDMKINAGQYIRGDEANLDKKTDSFPVVNTSLNYQVSRHLSLTTEVRNLFDKDYETFGLYGEADEVIDDLDSDERRFLSPGAPRTFWLRLKLHW